MIRRDHAAISVQNPASGAVTVTRYEKEAQVTLQAAGVTAQLGHYSLVEVVLERRQAIHLAMGVIGLFPDATPDELKSGVVFVRDWADQALVAEIDRLRKLLEEAKHK